MVEWPEAIPYVNLYMATCVTYRNPPPLQEVLQTIVNRLNAKDAATALAAARAGSVDDMMDMILRTCTGCGAAKDYDQALALLTQFTDDTNPLKLSRSRRARGFAITAHMCFEEGFTPDRGTMNIDAVHRGAVLADVAASLGFVAPIVLRIADVAERTGFRRAETCPPGHSPDRFLVLKDLWRVYDRRKAELERWDEARDARVLAMPNRYFCAAAGCGIEATHGSALSSCAGQCHQDWKPSYCSKACQRKDWARHKPFCRSGGTPDPAIALLRERIIRGEEEMGEGNEPPAVAAASGFVQRTSEEIASGRHERRINVAGPEGGGFTVSSSTMTPEFMRDVQYHVKQRAREGLKFKSSQLL